MKSLGLSVGAIQHDMPPDERKEVYGRDITYGTNNEFGFDYLRDNMVLHIEYRVQRQLNYAIVDEVDSILIDEARTPLIISGPVDRQESKFDRGSRDMFKIFTNDNTGKWINSWGRRKNFWRMTRPVRKLCEKLWLARTCCPKHPRLLEIFEDGTVLRDLLKKIDRSYAKEQKAELKSNLLYSLEGQ